MSSHVVCDEVQAPVGSLVDGLPCECDVVSCVMDVWMMIRRLVT